MTDIIDRRIAVEIMDEVARPYSTNIAEAWRVLEKLRKMFPWSDIVVKNVITQHEEYRWMASINTTEPMITSVGDSAPDAICQLALRAIKYRPEHEIKAPE